MSSGSRVKTRIVIGTSQSVSHNATAVFFALMSPSSSKWQHATEGWTAWISLSVCVSAARSTVPVRSSQPPAPAFCRQSAVTASPCACPASRPARPPADPGTPDSAATGAVTPTACIHARVYMGQDLLIGHVQLFVKALIKSRQIADVCKSEHPFFFFFFGEHQMDLQNVNQRKAY